MCKDSEMHWNVGLPEADALVRTEVVRDVLAQASDRLDAYTLELQRHGLDACEREVRWLEELITNERSGRSPSGDTPPTPAPPQDRP